MTDPRRLTHWLDRSRVLDTLSVAHGVFTAVWGADLILAQQRLTGATFAVAADYLPIPAWGTVFLILGACSAVAVVGRHTWRVIALAVTAGWWSMLAIVTTVSVFRPPPPGPPGAPTPKPGVPIPAWISLGMMCFILICAAAYYLEQQQGARDGA